MTDPRGPRGVRRPEECAPDGGLPLDEGLSSHSQSPDSAAFNEPARGAVPGADAAGAAPGADAAGAAPAGAADAADVGACVDSVLVAARALLGVVAVSLAPVLEQVTLAQFRALVLLSGLGPTRIGALARRLGVHQSTFTRTTDRMVEAGIVRRVENPDNRREVLVEATDTGLAYVREVTDRRRREVEQILTRLEADERHRVRLALEAFARAAGEPSAEMLAVLGG